MGIHIHLKWWFRKGIPPYFRKIHVGEILSFGQIVYLPNLLLNLSHSGGKFVQEEHTGTRPNPMSGLITNDPPKL